MYNKKKKKMELNFISNKFNLIVQNNNKCICSPMFFYNAINTLDVEKRFMICQYYIITFMLRQISSCI